MSQVNIGSRSSRLAVVQAQLICDRLTLLYPDINFELHTFLTRGDSNRHNSFGQLEGEGVFVKELEDALLQKKIDIAVHSLKDMPTVVSPRFSLAGVCQRENHCDVLISASGNLLQLASGSKIGTSSPRRSCQILTKRPDLEICEIRGNIETRLSKVTSGQLEAVVMAAAALIRLGLESAITEYLPVDVFIPAIGQGALGIETRSDDSQTISLIAPINHQPTWKCVSAERAFLKALGGGCRAPIAALCQFVGGNLHINGMVANPDDGTVLFAESKSNASLPESLGNGLAGKMIDMGAMAIIEKVRN